MRWTYHERLDSLGIRIIKELQVNTAYTAEDGCEGVLGL